MLPSGKVTLAHNAVAATTTSDEIDCIGFNAILIHVDLSASGTPNWTVKIQGSLATGGTFADCFYANSTTVMTTGALTADGCACFSGIPRFIKVVATENSGTGTCTVNVQPITL